MPKVQVGDIEMYYEIHGAGEPVVLISGLGAPLEGWRYQIPALAKEFQVVAFDNRGMGRTEAPQTPYSIEGFADDTAGLMDSLGIASASVVGASMGGMITQELGLRHPQRVRALVLCCTGPGGRRHVLSPHRTAFFEASVAAAKQPDNVEAVREVVKFMFAPTTMEARPEFVAEFIRLRSNLPPPPHGLALQTQALQSYAGTFDRLSQIGIPTMVITGEQDVMAVPENSRILHEHIRGSELKVIPNAGHSFFNEAPEAANEAILGFLRRLAKG